MLVRSFLACCLLAAGVVAPSAAAQQGSATANLETRLRRNPNDAALFQQYVGQRLQEAAQQMQLNPDAARRVLADLESLVGKLQATTPEAKQLVAAGQATIRSYRQQIDLAHTPLEELRRRLDRNPADDTALSLYVNKALREIGALVRGDPMRAGQQLRDVVAFLATVRQRAKDPGTIAMLDRTTQNLRQLEATIGAARNLETLVGKPAAPLQAEAWANGGPLTDQDLEGKVVLLDFWAIWCGPCIATFPQLRDWHTRYSDRGLVILGMTRYFNYKWDEQAGQPVSSPDPVSPEDERVMLTRFAALHQLKHPFAIQADPKFSQYYGVTGIPHVVVIDRQGIVRMMRVGSGEQNAADIQQQLEQLLGDAE